MGVQGLLRSLKTVTVQRHIREYRGQTVAIDTYSWLHRIIKGKCCSELYNFQISNKFISQILNRLDTFKQLGINVIMVFDGAPLPGKVEEQKQRKARRQQCQSEAMELLNQGKTQQGNKKLIESVDITPEIAYRLIEVLKKRNIPFIVAPYEADAQLAYLSRSGVVDVIITEDSDLLAYGAKKILYKYDINTLQGQQIELENVKNNEDPFLKYFSHCMFLSACIMSGCDYVSPIPGIGHKTAFKLVSSNGTGGKAIEEARRVKMVPQQYEQNFIKAYLIFRFQYVYCPKLKKCVMVNDIKKAGNTQNSVKWIDEIFDNYILNQMETQKYNQVQEFIGECLDDQMARGVGEGLIHPITFLPYSQVQIHQVINLKRSKSKVRRDKTPLDIWANKNKNNQKFNVKHAVRNWKPDAVSLELEPAEESQISVQENVTRPKLLVTNNSSKKGLASELQRLLQPVFGQEWFQRFSVVPTS